MTDTLQPVALATHVVMRAMTEPIHAMGWYVDGMPHGFPVIEDDKPYTVLTTDLIIPTQVDVWNYDPAQGPSDNDHPPITGVYTCFMASVRDMLGNTRNFVLHRTPQWHGGDDVYMLSSVDTHHWRASLRGVDMSTYQLDVAILATETFGNANARSHVDNTLLWYERAAHQYAKDTLSKYQPVDTGKRNIALDES